MQLYGKNFKWVDSVIPGQTEDLQSIQEALEQTEAY